MMTLTSHGAICALHVEAASLQSLRSKVCAYRYRLHSHSILPVISAPRKRGEFHPMRLTIRSGGNRWWQQGGRGRDNTFGPYPWEGESPGGSPEGERVWEADDRITLFTNQGLVHLGGQLRPVAKRQGEIGRSKRKYVEEDFMDPNQLLCLGALFNIAATNGLDTGRRFCVVGYCRSVEMLSAVVEDTVREQGGEVLVLEKHAGETLHERLRLTVALPFLWGVPPAVDSLKHAIRSGGGIVDKVYRQWEFL